KVLVPLSMPGVIAGLGLVFTSTLGFYVTPSLLGGPNDYMVTQSIYVALNSLNDFAGAAAQAVVLLAIVVLLLVLLRRFIGVEGANARTARVMPFRLGALSTLPERLVHALGPLTDFAYGIVRIAVYVIVGLTVAGLASTMVAVIPLGLSSDAF